MSSVVTGVLCLAALGFIANAQSGDLSRADGAFMKSAAEANMTEAHLGRMAQDQSANDNVKHFGQMLVQDHTKAYEELSVITQKTGESIPKAIDARNLRGIEGLAHAKGGAFDRSFVSHELEDHRKTIAEFKREAQNGHNPDLKAYAQRMIPKLEEHLRQAEELEKSSHRTESASARRHGR